ncbi:IPT/TIG domain-containing protein [Olivibacter sp. XZL3]|uniref:IPT/TIG domain-containing protein n=1 Tax=Olivibacter sp. XZL3 TaxID=1735116 RepID=UPI00106600AA|nr:IPT/TIG domain-containing protein [Olivibacter sp. XZL3]
MKKLVSTNTFWLFICSLSFCLNACKKDLDKHPQMLTEDPIAINLNTVEFKGKIVEKGEFNVIDYGFIYAAYPNIDDQNGIKVSLGNKASVGDFSTLVSNVLDNIYGSTVYVRSYLTNSNGTAYGSVKQVSLPIPSTSSVSPTAGKAGDLITISGQFHTTDTAAIAVFFMDKKATIKTLQQDKIVAEVPTGIQASHNSQIGISLQIGQQIYQASYDFRIQARIKDFTPKTGAIGAAVTLIGENLPSYYYGDQGIKMYFGNVEANFMYLDVPTYVVPPTIEETSKVYIEINGERSELPGEFKVLAPTVSAVSINAGLPGETIVITGTDFSTDWANLPKVKLGSYDLDVYDVRQNSITAVIPASIPSGTYALTVTSGPHTVTANNAFKVEGYSASSFSPKKGAINSLVKINGVFNANNYYEVSFGSTRVGATATSKSVLEVSVPYGLPAGKVKITVHFPNKDIKLADDFEVIGPSISSFSPSSGVPGTAVTITGEGFAADTWNTVVKFGTVEATITSITDTQIKVLVPSNVNMGAMKINVVSNGQTVTSKDDFTAIN